jgi:hypothetical protein
MFSEIPGGEGPSRRVKMPRIGKVLQLNLSSVVLLSPMAVFKAD